MFWIVIGLGKQFLHLRKMREFIGTDPCLSVDACGFLDSRFGTVQLLEHRSEPSNDLFPSVAPGSQHDLAASGIVVEVTMTDDLGQCANGAQCR